MLRDMRQQIDVIPKRAYRERVPSQSKGKIFALHEPVVDCISKGKSRVRYQFDTKINIGKTLAEGFVVGRRAMPDDTYDGHTLAKALEQDETRTDQRPALAMVDRADRGHGVEKTMVLISGQRRGLMPSLRTLLRGRSAIESEIGHMKADSRLARCPLKGTSGGAIFAVLCGCGHNIRKILAHLRALYRAIITWLLVELLWQELQNTGPQTA